MMRSHFRVKGHFITNGQNLARLLLDSNVNWKKLVINLTDATFYLDKRFLSEFVASIKIEAPELLADAQNIIWIHDVEELEAQIDACLETIDVFS